METTNPRTYQVRQIPGNLPYAVYEDGHQVTRFASREMAVGFMRYEREQATTSN